LVEAHLERSQASPLTIKFSPADEINCVAIEQAILDLLAAHCDRWETVELTGSTLLHDTLESIRGRLTILYKLHVRVYSGLEEPHEGLEVDISDLFESCPALEEVYVNASRFCGEMSVIAHLPCAQLIRYSASNPWVEHIHTLGRAVNPVDCVLRLIDPLDDVPPPNFPSCCRSSDASRRRFDVDDGRA
jgi:hypothetical protein